MGKGKAIPVAASLVIVVTGAFLFFYLRGPQPEFNLKPHEALGRAVAEEAVRLLGNNGRVIVIARDPGTFGIPAAEAQLENCCTALSKAGRGIAATNLLQLDPLRIASVPPEGFADRIRRGGESDVIVSFLGPPVLSDAQIQQLGDKRVSVVAVCLGDMPRRIDLKRLFNQRLLHAAIVHRPTPLPNPQPDAPWRSWFDAHFQIITPANLGDMPYHSSLRP